jgi:hypothetical protein
MAMDIARLLSAHLLPTQSIVEFAHVITPLATITALGLRQAQLGAVLTIVLLNALSQTEFQAVDVHRLSFSLKLAAFVSLFATEVQPVLSEEQWCVAVRL